MGKGNNSPPDSAYKQASLYPGLQKPVDKAINEAQNLYKGGWNQTPFNSMQTGAFQGAQNLLGQLGGQGQGGLNFASNVAQGGAMGGPGQNFLQGVYGQQTGGAAPPRPGPGGGGGGGGGPR